MIVLPLTSDASVLIKTTMQFSLPRPFPSSVALVSGGVCAHSGPETNAIVSSVITTFGDSSTGMNTNTRRRLNMMPEVMTFIKKIAPNYHGAFMFCQPSFVSVAPGNALLA
jgi:hypothetical protein